VQLPHGRRAQVAQRACVAWRARSAAGTRRPARPGRRARPTEQPVVARGEPGPRAACMVGLFACPGAPLLHAMSPAARVGFAPARAGGGPPGYNRPVRARSGRGGRPLGSVPPWPLWACPARTMPRSGGAWGDRLPGGHGGRVGARRGPREAGAGPAGPRAAKTNNQRPCRTPREGRGTQRRGVVYGENARHCQDPRGRKV